MEIILMIFFFFGAGSVQCAVCSNERGVLCLGGVADGHHVMPVAQEGFLLVGVARAQLRARVGCATDQGWAGAAAERSRTR